MRVMTGWMLCARYIILLVNHGNPVIRVPRVPEAIFSGDYLRPCSNDDRNTGQHLHAHRCLLGINIWRVTCSGQPGRTAFRANAPHLHISSRIFHRHLWHPRGNINRLCTMHDWYIHAHAHQSRILVRYRGTGHRGYRSPLHTQLSDQNFVKLVHCLDKRRSNSTVDPYSQRIAGSRYFRACYRVWRIQTGPFKP